MSKKLIPLLIASFAFAAGGVAWGQGEAEKSEKMEKGGTEIQSSVSTLKKQCASDIDKHCKGVTHGDGRIASCLDSKEDQLSEPCKKAKMDTAALISQKMEKAELEFRKNCSSDVQKFCADVPSGRGRLLECLGMNEEKLSGSCKNFTAMVEEKMAKFVG